LEKHKLEVWPGYDTSIMQCEKQLMINVDLRFKVLRTDTILQQIRNERGDMNRLNRMLPGQVVMTRYNNKTYTIVEILWDLRPSSTFDLKGTQTRYADYFRERYDITIQNNNQPMLRVKSSMKRDENGVPLDNYCNLVPELCYMTGMTDAMRANFKVLQSD